MDRGGTIDDAEQPSVGSASVHERESIQVAAVDAHQPLCFLKFLNHHSVIDAGTHGTAASDGVERIRLAHLTLVMDQIYCSSSLRSQLGEQAHVVILRLDEIPTLR